MYKTVLRDYIYNFKTAYKSLVFQDYFLSFYFIIVMPFSLRGDTSILDTYAVFFPLATALIISRMYGGQMPKTFYLCPLSVNQRQEYFKAGMKIRIIFTMVLFLLFNIPLLLDKLPLYMFIARFVITLNGTIALNIYSQPVYYNKKTGERKFHAMTGNYASWNVAHQIFHFLTLFILCAFEYDEKLWEIILTCTLMIISVCISVHITRTFYPQIINQASYYENTNKSV